MLESTLKESPFRDYFMSTEQRLKEKYQELNHLLNQEGDLPEEKLSNYVHQIGQKVRLSTRFHQTLDQTKIIRALSFTHTLFLSHSRSPSHSLGVNAWGIKRQFTSPTASKKYFCLLSP